MKIGSKLKLIRKGRGLTLQQVADATGLSIGFLSNVEREISDPTISALLAICRTLGVDLNALLQPVIEGKNIVRKQERREMFYSRESKVKFEAITEGNNRMKGYCITMDPGADYGDIPLGHPNEDELAIVIEGVLGMEMGGVQYVLKEGDSIYINAGVPHKTVNIGEEKCVFYCILV